MDYRTAVQKLERVRDLVENYRKSMYSSGPDVEAAAREICETYGEIQEVYQRFAGSRSVVVNDGGHHKTFDNYFEAGFLSGRTFHTHEGYTELLRVIGRVRQEVSDPTVPRDERSVSTVIEILHRFRECCQYIKEPPRDERSVQDIIWIMFRSR